MRTTAMIKKLIEMAKKRDGRNVSPCCKTWTKSLTIEFGYAILWYNVPCIDKNNAVHNTTHIVKIKK